MRDKIANKVVNTVSSLYKIKNQNFLQKISTAHYLFCIFCRNATVHSHTAGDISNHSMTDTANQVASLQTAI